MAAFLCGLALGGLVLTKAVFFYWLVLLAIGAVVLAFRVSRSRLLLVCALLPALILDGSWVARNVYHFGVFSISGRDGEVLNIRASFLDMTWPEYFVGFVFYTPPLLAGPRDAVLDAMPDQYWKRFVRSNKDGFYYRGKHPVGFDADTQAQRDELLMDAAKSKIIAHPLEYAAQSLLFAWSLAYPSLWIFYHPSLPVMIVYILAVVIAGLVSLIAPFALATVGLGALFRREWSLVGLFGTSLFSWAFYAAVSHGIPRYSTPIAPMLLVAAVVGLTFAWRRWRTRRAASRAMTNSRLAKGPPPPNGALDPAGPA